MADFVPGKNWAGAKKLTAKASEVVPSSDGLYARYVALSQESAGSGVDPKVREGAALFVATEEILNDEENFDDAMEKGVEAVRLFKEAGDEHSVADAARLVIHCHRAKALLARAEDSEEAAQEVLAKAKEVAQEELDRAKNVGNRRSEAIMMLSLEEVELEAKVDRTKKVGASEGMVDMCKKVVDILLEEGDKGMAGNTMLIMTVELLRLKRIQDARQMAFDAVELFREVNTEVMQLAKALHIYGSTLMAGIYEIRKLDEALDACRESAEIFQQCGRKAKKMEAYQYIRIAKWCITQDKFKLGLPYARKAMALFSEMKYGKGWQAQSLSCVNACLVGLNDVKLAEKTVREAVATYREGADERTLVLGLEEHALLQIELNSRGFDNDLPGALNEIEEAISLCRTIKDKSWEAHLLHVLGQLHYRSDNQNAGVQRVTEAANIFAELGEPGEQSVALQSLVDFYTNDREPDKAFQEAEKIRKVRQVEGDTIMEATALLTMAGLKAMKGEAKDALGMATEAQVMLMKAGDKRSEASAWGLMSEVYRSTGDWESTVRYAQTMEDILAQTNDKKAQAEGAKYVASMYHPADPQKALHSATKALTLYRACAQRCLEEVDMLTVVSASHMNLAVQLGEDAQKGNMTEAKMAEIGKKFDAFDGKALRPAKEAVALSRRLQARDVLGGALFQLGQVHMLFRRPEECLAANEEALGIFRDLGDRMGEANILSQKAETLFLCNMGDEAYPAAEEARLVCEAVGAEDCIKRLDAAQDGYERRGSGMPRRSDRGPAGAGRAAAEPAAPAKPAMDEKAALALCVDCASNCIGDDVAVELDAPLMDLGIDSLAAVEFREMLQQRSGISLPASLMFDYPCVLAISRHMVEMSSM